MAGNQQQDAHPPDFSTGPVQCVDMVAVNIFGRIILVPAEEHEQLCEELRQYHARLPGPPALGEVDGKGRAKRKRKDKGTGKRKATAPRGLFG